MKEVQEVAIVILKGMGVENREYSLRYEGGDAALIYGKNVDGPVSVHRDNNL